MRAIKIFLCAVVALASTSAFAGGNKHDIRFNMALPGVFAGDSGMGAMMNAAIEGEYFVIDNLSLGLRVGVATDFKADAGEVDSVLMFTPLVRYDFDLPGAPYWHVYAQFLIGVAIFDGDTAAADIELPSGGFYYQFTNRFALGCDLGLHIFVSDIDTAVGFHIGPLFSWTF